MTPTAGQPEKRRAATAVLAALGAATMALTTAPVAVSTPTGTLTTGAEVNEVEAQGDISIKFTELRQLIAHHEANGGVRYAAAHKMRSIIGVGEWYYDRGYNTRAALWVENARSTAAHPTWVPGETARTEIVAAIDELAALLRGLDS